MIRSTLGLSPITLAAEADAVAVTDEGYGRVVTDTGGVEIRGTVWILLSQVRDGDISTVEAREIVEETIGAGWNCSTDLYMWIGRKLESMG